VKPERNAAGTLRGYRAEDLTDAFKRYLPTKASEASETSAEQRKASDTTQTSDVSEPEIGDALDLFFERQPESVSQNETADQQASLTDLTDAADSRCRYCGEGLPEHMQSQRIRGYCNRSACREAAKALA